MSLLLVLIALLGDQRFKTREAAQICLSRCTNPLTVPMLEYYEKQHHHLEGRRRCGHLVGKWYEVNASQLTRGLGRLPWIDGGAVYCWYELLNEARPMVLLRGGPDYQEYRKATELWTARRIAARLPYSNVLVELWRAEWSWKWRSTPWPWCW